jgi:hypothetical protein
MEIVLVALLVIVVGAFWYYNRSTKSFDVNQDGKVDAADVKAAVQNVVCGVKETADVNKDGKVDAADVKVVAEKATTEVKKAATKTKAAAKKVADKAKASRKPKTKA